MYGNIADSRKFAFLCSVKYGCSSVGRALVSKTRCREFESLHPCTETLSEKDSVFFSALLPLSGLAVIGRGFHIRLLMLIYKKLVTLGMLFALRLIIGKQHKNKNVYGYVKPMPDFLEVRFCFHPNRVLLYRCILFYYVASRSTFFS